MHLRTSFCEKLCWGRGNPPPLQFFLRKIFFEILLKSYTRSTQCNSKKGCANALTLLSKTGKPHQSVCVGVFEKYLSPPPLQCYSRRLLCDKLFIAWTLIRWCLYSIMRFDPLLHPAVGCYHTASDRMETQTLSTFITRGVNVFAHLFLDNISLGRGLWASSYTASSVILM